MAVLTAPARIRKPTTTTKALRANLAGSGPMTFIARPPIRLSVYFACARSSGMSITARKLMPAVSTQAVDEDDEGRLLEVRQLRRLSTSR